MKKNYFAKNLNKGFITLSVIFCVLFGTSGFAQKNIAWTGATNTNWNTPTNWNYPAITSVGTYAGQPEVSPVVIFTASTTTLNLTGNITNIPVGARVSGVGIAPNTTVTVVGAYDATAKTTPFTLSAATTAGSDVAGNRLLFQYNSKITLTAANTEIAVGDDVSGFGIPMGLKIAEIDATQKIITITGNNIAGVGTPGTNVVFTFATPKAATGAPGIVDIAVISNGANLTLAGGSYYLGGLTISNKTGAQTGSTLNIPLDAEVFIETLTSEGLLIKGGNIVNNGFIDIKSSFGDSTNKAIYGSNNTAAAYGITFGLPEVVPSVPVEYMYSGTGTLKIDTSVGNNFSGGILFNGAAANASNATYKLLFNGTLIPLLSAVKSATGTATTQFIRAVGIGTLESCKVILGGAGFDMGDSLSGASNGLLAVSGGGVNVTIATGTTINHFSAITNPSPLFSMYVFGGTSIPAFINNKGTVNAKGVMLRSPISMSAQNNGVVNLVNDGTIDIDVNSTTGGQGGIAVTNNGGATLQADVNIINKGTFTIKTLLSGPSWGAPINMTTFSGAPNLHITNSGTLNLIGSNHSFGARPFNPDPANVTQTGASRITNTGTINTNTEIRSFYTINSSTGKINFASTSVSPLKLSTFTIPIGAAAAVGTTYTDSNSNVYTVAVAKVAATGTALVTHVASNIVNPATILASVEPPVAASALTKTGAGSGDASIIYTALTTNNFNALFANTANSGTINTNPGTTLMTGITGFNSVEASSILSPGGDTANGLVSYSEIAGDATILRGTLKMQATGSVTPGVDFDAMRLTGSLDTIDISGATLDVTGIYTPTVLTTIDIITTFIDPAPIDPLSDRSGGVIGDFASVVGLPAKWTVVNTGGSGGKIRLVYDPNLSVSQFNDAKFSYYPNPTRSQLNISATKNISKVELFNLLGQKVQSNTVNANQKQLDIANLQNGIYLMEVTIENAKESFKIVKQ